MLLKQSLSPIQIKDVSNSKAKGVPFRSPYEGTPFRLDSKTSLDWIQRRPYKFFKNDGMPAASLGPTTTCQPDFSSRSPLITAT